MDNVPLSNHNQLQRSPQQRAGVSRDQTAVVAVVAGASLGPTREQPVALAGPLLSPDQSLDCGPDHAGQQEQRRDQDVEEREGGEGHRRGEVGLSEEADVAHEGLWTEAQMRRSRAGFRARAPPTLAALSPQGRKPEAGSKGSRGTSGWRCCHPQSSHGTVPPGPASFIPGTPGALRLGQLCPLSDNSPQPENVNMLITKPPPQLCPPASGYLAWLGSLCYPEFLKSQAGNQPNKSC